MIEVYGFLAVFAVQLLATSVLQPVRLTSHVRRQAASLPTERLAKLYPGVDFDLAREHFFARYRAVNTGIAVLGLLLLGWFFTYMRRPDWDEDPVLLLTAGYFALQLAPIVFVTWLGFRFDQALKRSLPEGKRKATLQRRGLLDYISPFMVFVAVASYFLFVGFVIYVQQEPFPGYGLIGVLTLTYALQSIAVYKKLYGKRSNQFETHAARVHAIDLTVKVSVYSCIVCAAFFAFVFAADLMDLRRWLPLALSVCLSACALLMLMSLSAPPREPDVEELGSRPVS